VTRSDESSLLNAVVRKHNSSENRSRVSDESSAASQDIQSKISTKGPGVRNIEELMLPMGVTPNRQNNHERTVPQTECCRFSRSPEPTKHRENQWNIAQSRRAREINTWPAADKSIPSLANSRRLKGLPKQTTPSNISTKSEWAKCRNTYTNDGTPQPSLSNGGADRANTRENFHEDGTANVGYCQERKAAA
jgi:hypothetical protein